MFHRRKLYPFNFPPSSTPNLANEPEALCLYSPIRKLSLSFSNPAFHNSLHIFFILPHTSSFQLPANMAIFVRTENCLRIFKGIFPSNKLLLTTLSNSYVYIVVLYLFFSFPTPYPFFILLFQSAFHMFVDNYQQFNRQLPKMAIWGVPLALTGTAISMFPIFYFLYRSLTLFM